MNVKTDLSLQHNIKINIYSSLQFFYDFLLLFKYLSQIQFVFKRIVHILKQEENVLKPSVDDFFHKKTTSIRTQ